MPLAPPSELNRAIQSNRVAEVTRLPGREPGSGALSPERLATVRALADALLPRGGDFPLGAGDVDVAGRLSRHLAAFAPNTRQQIGALIGALEYAPLLTSPRRRFSRLTESERAAFIEAALNSRRAWQRLPMELLKQLCCLAFGSAPAFEAAIGFDHSCVSDRSPEAGSRLQPIMFPAIHGTVELRADACVIGSGAGGATVAKELAEAGLRVVILEEGRYFTQSDFDDTPFDRVVRCYRDNGSTMAIGPKGSIVPLPLGKAVGGTTVINSGTCFRTPDKILRAWESQWGIDGIDPDSMRPLFERVEAILHVKPVPWEIIGDNARLFDRGVQALGLHGAPLRRNIEGCRGCGVCAFGCPSDAKQAVHLSYLPLAESLGAQIYARCRVTRIDSAGHAATGVEAEILDRDVDEPRGRLRVRAPIVIVAAGTVHTPALLGRNGFGWQSGQLGRNLRLHPALSVSAHFPHEVYAWRGTMQSYYVDALADSHDVMIEVTSIVPGMAAALAPGVGAETKNAIGRLRHLASAGLFVSDTSSGRVVRGLGRRAEPWIFYRLNQRDARNLARGIALVARIFLEAGAEAVQTGLPPLPLVTSGDQLRELEERQWVPTDFRVTGFHPMGTCRMGRDPRDSVVGPRGQVHGVRGLYVADGSLFPSCVGVNPQVSIMAFATRIARGIAQG